ncbi:DUF1205 domain-containing protein [Streptomyces somaliensis]|uniref:nucleotide disphospho-sugar-binding domain-containing protein n=1 Tax=Streptomyces somaliensis TaxID=78355 RepID=UPI0020CFB8DA|nr:nucleotide disphospho-sugar-binding domain-containing protein [Streptomyces somaliensis]MCP9943702.1 DUF1205 domain-containing protein [Streptomyces somaliensis]MCP9963051.1 DUF1205 domain-containing protein [Streptomyces somaliensis]MCP9975901.1 DUF1205 domain-containing protein [Streptomyces somaliensis]
MKVLLVTPGWPTHVFMIVPLAWALRVQGHEVRVASPPSGIDAVVRAGLPAVELGPDIDLLELRRRAARYETAGNEKPADEAEVRNRLAGEDGSRIMAVWQEISFSATKDLVGFARSWRPDLVVSDSLVAGGLVAGRAIGVPAVRHLFGIDILGTEAGEGLLGMLPGYHDRFRRYGVEVTGDPAHLTLSPFPPSMQPATPARLPMRYIPYNGPAELPSWLLQPAERPRTVITWGTSSAWSAGEHTVRIPQILDALADSDGETVVTIGRDQRPLVGEPPPGVRLVENVPLHFLMPSCDLLVHQGGASTMLTAASYGVPQLTVPHLNEQIQDAEAHAATGAGICLPAERAEVPELRDALKALRSDPAYHRAAGRIRAEMQAQPSPVRTVRVLEELVG